MSTALAGLQRAFLAAVRGNDAAPLIRRLAEGGIAPDIGLGIYRNAYGARLREALENDHPVLGKYLGDALWAQLCDGYLSTCPSTVRSLRHFGDGLPQYLASTRPFAAMPQIGELAGFERALLDVFDAADSTRADWQTLLAADQARWPLLQLRFHPSVCFLAMEWNTVDIWTALKNDSEPPASRSESSHWLLWRDDERVTRFRSLATDESLMLQCFLHGNDFAEICERLLELHPAEAVPAVAIGLLRQWSVDGVVRRWRCVN